MTRLSQSFASARHGNLAKLSRPHRRTALEISVALESFSAAVDAPSNRYRTRFDLSGNPASLSPVAEVPRTATKSHNCLWACVSPTGILNESANPINRR